MQLHRNYIRPLRKIMFYVKRRQVILSLSKDMGWLHTCFDRLNMTTHYYPKKSIILFFNLIVFGITAQDSVYTRKVINALCSKQFAGRGYVNNGLDIAAKYIVGELKKFKTEQLFNTGYYQWFDFNVNTFPAKMSVKVDGKILKPGIDFIVSPESTGLKGKFDVEKKDSVTYLSKNSQLPL